MALAILTLCFALGVSGGVACSTTLISPPTSEAAAVQDVWQLTLDLTGGFAGMDRHLELASSGELKVTDRKRRTQVTTKASASELAQIASMVRDLKPIEGGRGSPCRDCIQYDLKVEVNGRSLVFSTNDVNMSGTAIEPLVNVLTRVLNRELSR